MYWSPRRKFLLANTDVQACRRSCHYVYRELKAYPLRQAVAIQIAAAVLQMFIQIRTPRRSFLKEGSKFLMRHLNQLCHLLPLFSYRKVLQESTGYCVIMILHGHQVQGLVKDNLESGTPTEHYSVIHKRGCTKGDMTVHAREMQE